MLQIRTFREQMGGVFIAVGPPAGLSQSSRRSCLTYNLNSYTPRLKRSGSTQAGFHQVGSERNPRTPKCNRIEASTCSPHPYGMLRAGAQRPASGTHQVPTKDQGRLASPLPSETVLSAAAYHWSPDRDYRKAQGVAVNCSEAPAEQARQGP